MLQKWSCAKWAPPRSWFHETHSSSRTQMKIWCTWTRAQTSANMTPELQAYWEPQGASATRPRRPSMVASSCAAVADSTRRRWRWSTAAAASSTGAATSSANSAARWSRCTRVGDPDCRTYRHHFPTCTGKPDKFPSIS